MVFIIIKWTETEVTVIKKAETVVIIQENRQRRNLQK